MRRWSLPLLAGLLFVLALAVVYREELLLAMERPVEATTSAWNIARPNEGASPLKIVSGRSKSHLVRVIEHKADREEMVIFIAAGERFEGTLPVGLFRFRVATGEKWYGPEALFGPKTSYFEIYRTGTRGEKIVAFEFTRLQGHEIQFDQWLGGLGVDKISAGAFRQR